MHRCCTEAHDRGSASYAPRMWMRRSGVASLGPLGGTSGRYMKAICRQHRADTVLKPRLREGECESRTTIRANAILFLGQRRSVRVLPHLQQQMGGQQIIASSEDYLAAVGSSSELDFAIHLDDKQMIGAGWQRIELPSTLGLSVQYGFAPVCC